MILGTENAPGTPRSWLMRSALTLAGAVASLALGAATAHDLRLPSPQMAAAAPEVVVGEPAFEARTRANALAYAYVPATPPDTLPPDATSDARNAANAPPAPDEAQLQDVSSLTAITPAAPTGSGDDPRAWSAPEPGPLPAAGGAVPGDRADQGPV